MKIQKIRGTRDIFGPLSARFLQVEKIIRRVFDKYSYSEIRTPVFEETALFTRTIGVATDIVEKEMYSFPDKKGRNLTLRPEGTAGVVRACIENSLCQPGRLNRLYYMGKMYRYERPQEGRYREFSQAGIELIGSADPFADLEVISIAMECLEALSASKLLLKINLLGCDNCKKQMISKIHAHFTTKKERLCTDCHSRLERNPLRILDCKNDACRVLVKESSQQLLNDRNYCPDCSAKFDALTGYLKDARIGGEYVVDPYLVRGLDYYTGVVFEIVNAEGLALAAGGRYDKLISELGGPDLPATGFAFGLDRLVDIVDIPEEKNSFRVLAAVCDNAWSGRVVPLLAGIKNGISFEYLYGQKSLSKLFAYASKQGFDLVLLFGSNELQSGSVSVKDLNTQAQVSVTFAQLADHIINKVRMEKA